MRISRFFVYLILANSLLACTDPKDNPRTLTLLHINDIYRIEGVDAGSVGGIARIRTLRKQLESEDPGLLVLHAGDMLFPSALSRQFKGRQMVDALNQLDGQTGSFDSRMFAVFGNHEFDIQQLDATDSPAEILDAAVDESEFYWLASNISFDTGPAGKRAVEAPHLVQKHLTEINGIRVGIFGITTDINTPAYGAIDADYIGIAKQMTKTLRDEGAEIVIALTHLFMAQDEEILQLGESGPDLIMGGHEHNKQFRQVKGRYVIKADADARTASVTRITLNSDGTIAVDFRFEPLDAAVLPDPAITKKVNHWVERFDQAHCKARNETPDCLNRELGKTAAKLEAEELVLRRYETGLGNWVADQALKQFRQQGAQIAFVNSGSFRLNQNIPANTVITERHLNELFPFPGNLALLKINGAVLQQAVDHAIEDWNGNGWWLQIAGFAFVHNPEQQTATQLSLLTPDGPRLVKPDEEIIAVVNDYLIDLSLGQDGYTFLSPAQLITYSGSPISLKGMVRSALKDAGVISPGVEGRVCNTVRGGPCLLASDSAP